MNRHGGISRRRRALFPSDEDSTGSDLGCISPLNLDNDSLEKEPLFSLNKSVGDYDIIGLVDKTNTFSTPKNTSVGVLDVITPSHVTDIADDSPTQKLKTPHDTSTNIVLPKLIRRPVSDTVLTQNLDVNKSKVRTALFPEMPLPSKSFYPKNHPEITPSLLVTVQKKVRPRPARTRKMYLCGGRGRRFSGQINAGVSHKIKKVRRPKKFKKIDPIETAINIIENSPLNSVLASSNVKVNEPVENCSSPETSVEEKEMSPEPEIDHSKKFFKSSRHKGVVTVNQNIKLEVNNGKISLLKSKNGLKRPRKQEQTVSKKVKLSNDFNEVGDSLISTNEISGIISALEEKENVNEHTNSLVLMSPTSQMCNMTSGLALNSPKKVKNLTPVLEDMAEVGEEKKLFPVFYPGLTSVSSPKVDDAKCLNVKKKFKALSKDQMLLDAGQKRFGVTQCSECKIVYHMGDPGDEIMHLNYHNAGHIFRFNGWKNERVVSNNLVNGKIIQILPTDPKIWWKKVKDVMEVVNRDLGFYDIEFNALNSQVFFYIKNKIIVGVVTAEVKTTGYKLLTTQQDQVDLCSEESFPVKCGISRIWVSHNYRKKGIATALLDSVKRNFMFGCILENGDIAFSTPTEMGKVFGKSYFKTPNFLIYLL